MIFIESYNAIGGAQRTLRRMAETAVKLNLDDSYVLLTSPTEEVENYYRDSGIDILRFNAVRINNFGNSKRWLTLRGLALGSFWTSLYSLRIGWMIKRLKGPIVCCDYRAFLLTIVPSLFLRRKVYLYLVGGVPLPRTVLRVLNKLASDIHFISEELGKEYGIDSPKVLRNGIDISQIRKRVSNPSAVCRFVFVGTLVQQKGLHVIIRSLQKLTRYQWHLDVFGDFLAEDVYYKDFIESILDGESRVQLQGKVDDIFDRLPSYDALVFGSQFFDKISWENKEYSVSSTEGSPTVIIEAALTGISVLASDSTGVKALSEELPNVRLLEWSNFSDSILQETLESRKHVENSIVEAFDYSSIYSNYLKSMYA